MKLTERYITDRSFPDKAIDALDEVGSKVQIKNAKMPPSIIEKEKQIKDVEEEKDRLYPVRTLRRLRS